MKTKVRMPNRYAINDLVNSRELLTTRVFFVSNADNLYHLSVDKTLE